MDLLIRLLQLLNSALGFLQRLQRYLGPDLLPLELQKRRCAVAVALGLGSWLLRPIPPFQWLPGVVIGALLLWAAIELAALAWRPQRWQ
jgi:hypothetical protein